MKTRQALFFFTVFTLLAFERNGYCDGPAVQDIPPGEDTIVSLKKDERAPFTGQLFDPPTALRWANWLQQYKLRLQTDVEAQKKICAADAALGQRKLEIEQEKNTVITGDLRQQGTVKDARISDLEKQIDSPPFYKTFWFGATIGVVVTGALFGLGAYVASSH